MPNISVATYGSNDATLANFMKQGVCHTLALPFTLKGP